jgi:hypothetical protein
MLCLPPAPIQVSCSSYLFTLLKEATGLCENFLAFQRPLQRYVAGGTTFQNYYSDNLISCTLPEGILWLSEPLSASQKDSAISYRNQSHVVDLPWPITVESRAWGVAREYDNALRDQPIALISCSPFCRSLVACVHCQFVCSVSSRTSLSCLIFIRQTFPRLRQAITCKARLSLSALQRTPLQHGSYSVASPDKSLYTKQKAK